MNSIQFLYVFLHYQTTNVYSYDKSITQNNRADWQRWNVLYLLRWQLRKRIWKIPFGLGNGGVKLSRTYQENEKLSGYVMDLQTFDKVLLKAQKNGVITIEKNMITDIESATFEI